MLELTVPTKWDVDRMPCKSIRMRASFQTQPP